ncbi:hypothetical protein [Sneathiella glossodoripedis]|uniref:hypothetical protein n=1 Tax=Sneathiella glossodoripedis TaxID=418853 RepID=UPI00046F59EE|nr:hypothetical protein [Sneathiella glossodoripedis]
MTTKVFLKGEAGEVEVSDCKDFSGDLGADSPKKLVDEAIRAYKALQPQPDYEVTYTPEESWIKR